VNIQKSTQQYEQWLLGYTPLIEEDLAQKHTLMASGPFPFLRGTFYRWSQRWPKVCPDLAQAPAVLSVGDLHVENFGTWRDQEGRLAWGVNDFDEAAHLPYTHDLVRLTGSAHLAIQAGKLRLGSADACDAVLSGYSDGLKAGGRAFVLAEDHDWLRRRALGSLSDPVTFWQKFGDLPSLATGSVPESALAALQSALPASLSGEPGREVPPMDLKHRAAGVGSLGRPRYVAILEWESGHIAREAKAMAPSAALWAHGHTGPAEILYQGIVDRSVRCRDPFVRLQGHWLVRRLAPDCSRIEIMDLPGEWDAMRLLHAMGWETANIHLGSSEAIPAVHRDMKQRPIHWLHEAAEKMVLDTQSDWRDWKKD
jgi:hypothetical protein